MPPLIYEARIYIRLEYLFGRLENFFRHGQIQYYEDELKEHKIFNSNLEDIWAVGMLRVQRNCFAVNVIYIIIDLYASTQVASGDNFG